MKPHLQKIKLLLNLSKSPEPGEAANAAAMAQKLIIKFSVTPEQLQEIESSDKPIYTDENLLLDAPELADWINIIALAICNKYDCYAIQEENIISTGEKSYKYYVYGEQEDIAIVKQLFNFIYSEINKLIITKCPGRGQLYIDSFAEGAANGVRNNIECENFSINGIVLAKEKEDVKPDAIETVEKSPMKPPAIEKKTKTTNKEKPLDIIAYFFGEGLGRNIHIGDIQEGKFLPNDVIDVSDLSKLFKP